MATAEKLARLTVQTSKFDSVGRSTNPNGLTAQDIAGAAAGLPRHVYLLLRFKWALDETVYQELESLTLSRSTGIREVLDWHPKKKGALRILCQIALKDVCSSGKCKACNGTKYTPEQKTCPVCDGTGFNRQEIAWIADQAGITRATYYRGWQKPYASILDMLRGWDSYGIGHVRRNLSDS